MGTNISAVLFFSKARLAVVKKSLWLAQEETISPESRCAVLILVRCEKKKKKKSIDFDPLFLGKIQFSSPIS